MATDAEIRAGLVEHWQSDGVDYDRSHRIYHDDAVLEFPQSGERFVGKAAFLEWRRQYPARLTFRIRRFTSGGNLWVAENLITYDDGAPMFTVNILTFRGDRVAREALYVMEGFAAPDWRMPWATRFDPFAAVTPAEWREGMAFGIDTDPGTPPGTPAG